MKKVADAGGDYGEETDIFSANFEKQIINRTLVHGKSKSTNNNHSGLQVGAGKLATDEENKSNQSISETQAESHGSKQSFSVISDNNNKPSNQQPHEVQVLCIYKTVLFHMTFVA